MKVPGAWVCSEWSNHRKSRRVLIWRRAGGARHRAQSSRPQQTQGPTVPHRMGKAEAFCIPHTVILKGFQAWPDQITGAAALGSLCCWWAGRSEAGKQLQRGRGLLYVACCIAVHTSGPSNEASYVSGKKPATFSSRVLMFLTDNMTHVCFLLNRCFGF